MSRQPTAWSRLSHYYTMPIKVRWSGCLASIVLSVIATIVLNLLLRACGT